MSSGRKRHLSPSPLRISDSGHKSHSDVKRGKYTKDESESSYSHSSSSSDSSPERKSRRKKKDRKRKHRHRSSSSGSSSSPRRKKKKKEKKKKKHKNKKRKKHKSEKHKHDKTEEKTCNINKSMNKTVESKKANDSQAAGPSPRVMKPMTKEEWEKQQSVVRRVYDPETGRNRLVKGDGEIIEEIVSKDRHRDINKQATRGDGAFYQAKLGIQDK